uniref:BHLH domain-containing protein n=1 Tax=Picea sitchensis TaxID=3332 RepID=C0PR61_PICSI|nr:unknown [Picea sitchensis]
MMGSPQCNKWMSFLEDNLLEDVSQPANSFFWPAQPVNVQPDCSAIPSDSKNDKEDGEKMCPRKRPRDESCSKHGIKACREKMRRERLNDRFTELSILLEPGRPPKTDKSAILSDALSLVNQLREEAGKLKDSNEQLRQSIKELKTEKNELRDEKTRLKAEKERLDQQMKAMMTSPPGFMPHLAVSHAFSAQSQAANSKTLPIPGFPGMAMWQWMPPAAVDTSQDHALRPPVA